MGAKTRKVTSATEHGASHEKRSDFSLRRWLKYVFLGFFLGVWRVLPVTLLFFVNRGDDLSKAEVKNHHLKSASAKAAALPDTLEAPLFSCLDERKRGPGFHGFQQPRVESAELFESFPLLHQGDLAARRSCPS